jgi:hypothetical protein
MVTSVTKGGTQKFSQNLRLLKPTDMTSHWKALDVDDGTINFSIQPNIPMKELIGYTFFKLV